MNALDGANIKFGYLRPSFGRADSREKFHHAKISAGVFDEKSGSIACPLDG